MHESFTHRDLCRWLMALAHLVDLALMSWDWPSQSILIVNLTILVSLAMEGVYLRLMASWPNCARGMWMNQQCGQLRSVNGGNLQVTLHLTHWLVQSRDYYVKIRSRLLCGRNRRVSYKQVDAEHTPITFQSLLKVLELPRRSQTLLWLLGALKLLWVLFATSTIVGVLTFAAGAPWLVSCQRRH